MNRRDSRSAHPAIAAAELPDEADDRHDAWPVFRRQVDLAALIVDGDVVARDALPVVRVPHLDERAKLAGPELPRSAESQIHPVIIGQSFAVEVAKRHDELLLPVGIVLEVRCHRSGRPARVVSPDEV